MQERVGPRALSSFLSYSSRSTIVARVIAHSQLSRSRGVSPTRALNLGTLRCLTVHVPNLVFGTIDTHLGLPPHFSHPYGICRHITMTLGLYIPMMSLLKRSLGLLEKASWMHPTSSIGELSYTHSSFVHPLHGNPYSSHHINHLAFSRL